MFGKAWASSGGVQLGLGGCSSDGLGAGDREREGEEGRTVKMHKLRVGFWVRHGCRSQSGLP